MKLISMTDLVLEQHNWSPTQVRFDNEFSNKRFRSVVSKYANFLKQLLTLGMFVPCDDDGNVLEIPTKENSNNTIDHDSKLMDYNDAKSKVLFNGFQVRKQSTYSIVSNKDGDIWVTWNKSKTIEDLIPYNLDLAVSF